MRVFPELVADWRAPPARMWRMLTGGDYVWLLGRHHLVCGDSTDAGTVERVLDGVRPHLMVTDPPYSVAYDPAWRNRAGLNNTRRVGKVENDNRADWREAWSLLPGDVAYALQGALHATTAAESLTACGFQIRAHVISAKDRLVLGRGTITGDMNPARIASTATVTGPVTASRRPNGRSPAGRRTPIPSTARRNQSNACAGGWKIKTFLVSRSRNL